VKSEEPVPHEVVGERGVTAVHRSISLHSRLGSVLAMTLMSVLGLGSLTWYYANTMTGQSRARQSAQRASASRAQGEMALPSLGRIDPPVAAPLESTMPPLARPADPIPLAASTMPQFPLGGDPANGAPLPKSPAEIALERQLSGAVFGSQGASPSTSAVATGALPPVGSGSLVMASHGSEPGELSALLRPSVAAAVRAQVLPAQRLLLPKGAFIDCTLETAIDSTLPGMTTCVMATDAFGADGDVVLLERGTKLIGETRGQVQQGAARIFVLWTEARTPTGVIVPLASPGADELGRAGLPGAVNTHFWERFGAALLVSVVDGAVTAAAQSSRNGNGTVVIEPSASQGVLTEILKSTINIPPTVVKQNGDRIQVLVARDLDFRSVYELRSVAPGR
jgi:type IV secretion system protein VirB10